MGSCHPVHPKKETLQKFADFKREGSLNKRIEFLILKSASQMYAHISNKQASM
jgi:hypothetical protein